MSPGVSVIIPIYKVEAFIERCARSLMGQTLKDAEFIFVDDGSPDGSVGILKNVVREYPERKTVILRHKVNRGLPAARNTGLAHATGEYILHCDSDDYLEHDALERMFEAAKETDADIVYSDWYLDCHPSLTLPVGAGKPTRGRMRYMPCPEYDSPEEALRGLLHGTMKYNVWNKLVRKNLYGTPPRPIRFPDGHGMGEDMTMILLFAKAGKVTYLPKSTYHYVRQNENAFTAIRSESSYRDLIFNANRIISALDGCVSAEDLACFKLNVKYPFIISNRREDHDRWQRWFPEANAFILKHHVSKRARLLEWCAGRNLHWLLNAHYFLLQHLS